VNVDGFLACSQRQPHDGDTGFMEDFTVAGVRHFRILFPQRRAIVDREGATGKTKSPIVADGETALDRAAISVFVAALRGS
jgi:hypothetical protein